MYGLNVMELYVLSKCYGVVCMVKMFWSRMYGLDVMEWYVRSKCYAVLCMV
jgi:hypothetical protein